MNENSSHYTTGESAKLTGVSVRTVQYYDANGNKIAANGLLNYFDVTDDGNGSAEASLDKATSGTEVTLTATPDEGYVFDKWEVTYRKLSTDVTVTVEDNKFTMPNGAVTVKAIFKEASATPPTPTIST